MVNHSSIWPITFGKAVETLHTHKCWMCVKFYHCNFYIGIGIFDVSCSYLLCVYINCCCCWHLCVIWHRYFLPDFFLFFATEKHNTWLKPMSLFIRKICSFLQGNLIRVTLQLNQNESHWCSHTHTRHVNACIIVYGCDYMRLSMFDGWIRAGEFNKWKTHNYTEYNHWAFPCADQ